MRLSTTTLVISLVATCLSMQAISQTSEEIRKKYPGEQAVMMDHSMHYRISVRDGQPQVQSDESQRLLFFPSQTSAYLSKYGFYHSSFHELQRYSAYTVTAEGKNIKVTDFKTASSKSNEVFYDDVKETTFDFPAVAPGSMGILETSMLHKDPHMLSPFFFSRAIPVVNAELKISFPQDMTVKYLLKGNDTARVKVLRDVRHGEVTYSFQIKDQPAEKTYEDAPGNGWYGTHVVFYIEKYSDAQGRTVSYLANPGDLYKMYVGYLKNINKEAGPELRGIVDSLCRNAGSPEDKARNIYNWVQQSIRYIAFEQGMEGFIPRDANLVCSRRFGDCKDMSSILTLMLRTAGIPAYYTWIGTRELPYAYTETPLPIVDNHMICTIRLNDQYFFLDGTDPFCVFGMPTEFIQGKEAMIAIDDSTYKIQIVPPPSKEVNQLIDSTILDLTDKGLKGRITVDLSGYFSMQQLEKLSYSNRRDWDQKMRDYFNRGSNKFYLDSFRLVDGVNKGHTRLDASFTLTDYAKHIGDEWYINMNLFKFYEHEEIDYPKRTMPIQFPFRYRRKYIVVLNIPEGNKVTYIPSGKTYNNPIWGFRMIYEKKGRQVIFTQEFDNDHLLLLPSQFADWNKVLENLFPLYRETVSLQKEP